MRRFPNRVSRTSTVSEDVVNGPFEWYQVLMGFLLVGVVVCIVPVQKLTKFLWAELRTMWRESDDSVWAKLFQTVVFVAAYILGGTAVYYATFRIGALLPVWWQGTVGGLSVLTLLALCVLFAWKVRKRAAAQKRQDA